MPNKYSHALVLSHYESHGLIDFDRPRASKPTSSRSARSTESSQSSRSAPQPSRYQDDPLPPHPTSADRLVLQPSPREQQSVYTPRHGHASSVETQIFNPLQTSSQRQTGPSPRRALRTTCEAKSSVDRSLQRHSRRNTVSLLDPPTFEELQAVSLRSRSRQFASSSTQTQSPPKEKPYTSGRLKEEKRRLSSDTAIYSPLNTDTDTRTLKHQQAPLEPSGYAPRHPPSPPLTPQHRYSFSLDADDDDLLPTQLAPPILDRNIHRTPPSSSASASTTQTSLPTPQEASISRTTDNIHSHPQTAPNQPRPLSVLARHSSTNAVTSPTISDFSSANPSHSPVLDLDADLEPLPPLPLLDIPKVIDLDILPWDNPSTDPSPMGETWKDTFSSPISTRASSFDSAAPPPIARAPRQSLLPTQKEKHLQREITLIRKRKPQEPSPKSVPLFRTIPLTTPKAIPYTQTIPGIHPHEIAVSRTAAPSIPTIFAGYQGPFPPSVVTTCSARGGLPDCCKNAGNHSHDIPKDKGKGKATNKSSNTSPPISSTTTPPTRRLSLRLPTSSSSSSSTQRARPSTSGSTSGPEKRRSWFGNTSVTQNLDRALGFGEVREKGGRGVRRNLKEGGLL